MTSDPENKAAAERLEKLGLFSLKSREDWGGEQESRLQTCKS